VSCCPYGDKRPDQNVHFWACPGPQTGPFRVGHPPDVKSLERR